jgi:hypothetical protein
MSMYYLAEFDHEACDSTSKILRPMERSKNVEMQPPSKDRESDLEKLKLKRDDWCRSNRYFRFRWVLEM